MKNKEPKTEFDKFTSNPKQRKIFEKEMLALEAIETISFLMEETDTNPIELAKKLRISKTKMFNLLNGKQTLTLSMLSDCLFELGYIVSHFSIRPLVPQGYSPGEEEEKLT